MSKILLTRYTTVIERDLYIQNFFFSVVVYHLSAVSKRKILKLGEITLYLLQLTVDENPF